MFDLRAPEFRQNPYPFLQELRAHAPICRVEPNGLWAISRHEHVVYILKNHECAALNNIQEQGLKDALHAFLERCQQSKN